ncbi:hypothetical protein EVAR_33814_1 [Eumeta japonica]|uniref:Uncharacterized protein n=1 Tax=Eumeta variegata TaxID=151549 RepID=A0A4C1VBB8_EUMVA|nr:hypothetical protein EVAR_33814_1 [Eumeta japonica]
MLELAACNWKSDFNIGRALRHRPPTAVFQENVQAVEKKNRSERTEESHMKTLSESWDQKLCKLLFTNIFLSETVATFDSVSKIADANPPSASRPTLTTVGRFHRRASSNTSCIVRFSNSAADGLGPIAAMGTARTVFDLRELHKKDRA